MIPTSAKTGEGVDMVFEAIIEHVPPPTPPQNTPLRAMLFDSHFDEYRGVITSVRVVEGKLRTGQRLHLAHANQFYDAQEVGLLTPERQPVSALHAGQVGYIIAGIKTARDARVGDTFVEAARAGKVEALGGFQDAKPMVFASMYPTDSGAFVELAAAVEKLALNDPSVSMEKESSGSIGAATLLASRSPHPDSSQPHPPAPASHRHGPPLWLPWPPAHGRVPRAPHARVRHAGHPHRTHGAVHCPHGRWCGAPGPLAYWIPASRPLSAPPGTTVQVEKPSQLPVGKHVEAYLEPMVRHAGEDRPQRPACPLTLSYLPQIQASIVTPQAYVGNVIQLLQSRRVRARWPSGRVARPPTRFSHHSTDGPARP